MKFLESGGQVWGSVTSMLTYGRIGGWDVRKVMVV